MTITYALIWMVTKIAERSVPKARVTELIMSDGACSMNVRSCARKRSFDNRGGNTCVSKRTVLRRGVRKSTPVGATESGKCFDRVCPGQVQPDPHHRREGICLSPKLIGWCKRQRMTEMRTRPTSRRTRQSLENVKKFENDDGHKAFYVYDAGYATGEDKTTFETHCEATE